MAFSAIDFMKQVKEAAAMQEALKRKYNRLIAEARYDPNMREEDRSYAEQLLREGFGKIGPAQRILERGYSSVSQQY